MPKCIGPLALQILSLCIPRRLTIGLISTGDTSSLMRRIGIDLIEYILVLPCNKIGTL